MLPPILAAVWRVNRVLPIVLAVLALVNLGTFGWIQYGLTPKIAALERQYSDTRAQARRTEEVGSPQERWQQAAQDLENFREAIPRRVEFTGLISELFGMANSAGLSLDRVGYNPKPESDLLRYDLVFSVRGDYRQIKTFIHALEQSSRIIAIEGISLAGQKSAEDGAVSLSISLSTYFISDPA